MARIQNRNYPWTQLRLRSGRVVQTDGDGVIDGITEEEAAWLGATPGWHAAGPIGEVRTEAPVSVSRRPVPVPAAREVPPEPQPPSGGVDGADDSEEEGPDIDAIRTKAEALKVAAEFGVAGLTEDMKLAEMKAKLNAALYPESDEEE